jgi:hypothetical protein
MEAIELLLLLLMSAAVTLIFTNEKRPGIRSGDPLEHRRRVPYVGPL